MAAKLIRTMSNDNSDMQRHIGCMSGIFHLFGRGHFLSGWRVSGQTKRLTAGKNDAEGNEALQESTMKSSTAVVMEKQRVSTDSSRSHASPPCKSSIGFSSMEDNRTTKKNPERSTFRQQRQRSPEVANVVKDSILYRDVRGISVKASLTYIDSPRPSLPSPKSANPKLYGFRESVDALPTFGNRFLRPKESPRFSYDGRESKSNMKIKELPRYSLDSKRPTSPQNDSAVVNQEHGSHRRQSSIVAKLMGLEDLEEMDMTSTFEAHVPLSRSEESKPSTPSRSQNPRIPVELAPWKRPEGKKPNASNCSSPSVYGQIEKRLGQLEFQKSGKDLRALKQILQAMQKSKKETETSLDSGLEKTRNVPCSSPNSPTIKRVGSPMNPKSPRVVMRPEPAKIPTSVVVPVPGLRKLDLGDKKRGRDRDLVKLTGKVNQPSLESRSPSRVSGSRLQQKKPNPSDFGKRTNQSKVNTKVSSYGGSNRLGMGSDNSSSNTVSLQSDGEISINSQEEMEVTSAYRTQTKKMESRLRDNDLSSKPITTEQPSPVSVLDAITFGDEPLSPVRMIKNTFEDVEPLNYNKTRERTELNSSSEIMYLSLMKPIQYEEEINSTNRGYVSEILLESGLLHPPRHRIIHNSPLDLEKFNHSNKITNGAKSKCSNEIEKRLISDVVNEILVQKIMSNHSRHWLNSITSEGRIKQQQQQQQQLLKRLCSEIDELPCSFDDDEDGDCFTKMLEKDLNHQSANWKLGFNDISGVVLDIERMIFRDIICEALSSEATALRARYAGSRRQLFQN